MIMNRATLAVAVLAAAMIPACAQNRVPQGESGAREMQDMREEVSRIVVDVERREKLHAAIQRYEDELRTFQQTVLEFQGLLHALNADPAASGDQFSNLISRYEFERKAARARLLKIHFDLLGLTTEDEWRFIAKREAKLLRVAADPAGMRVRT
jgi:septal ring factor EnvC (AmiA/AmiB activator)